MTPNLPACDRCGAGSYDGNSENPRCPWCHRSKYLGSTAEMAEQIRKLREVAIAAVGFIAGASVRTPDSMKQWLVDVIKETE